MKPSVTVDIEPTNRCNAKCHFCPRDATPHQGLMTPEIFSKALDRTVELREMAGVALDTDVKISMCGLGEPLLNPKTPSWVRRVRDEGFECVMSSNGAILDERRGNALLEADLRQININVGDEGEDYEDVYKLPFEKTLQNVLRFKEMAGDQCQVNIVLVDYKRDRKHIGRMVKYWQARGLTDFVFFDIMNRGGALFVDEMQFESYPQLAAARAMFEARGENPVCGAPFIFLFVGYDGNYYLCCSDWTKKVPLGSVFDTSFIGVTKAKLEHVTSREPICKTCNWDPLNRLTEELRAVEAGEADPESIPKMVDELIGTSQAVQAMLQKGQALLDAETPNSNRRGPSIPVNVV